MKTDIKKIINGAVSVVCSFSVSLLLLLTLLPTTGEFSLQHHYFALSLIPLLSCSLGLILFFKFKISFTIQDILCLIIFLGVCVNYNFISPIEFSSSFLHFTFLAFLFFAVRIFTSYSKVVILVAFAVILCIGIKEAWTGLMQAFGMSRSNHHLYLINGTFFNPGPYGGYLCVVLSMALAYIAGNYYDYKGKLNRNIKISPDLLKPEFFLYILSWVATILISLIFFAVFSRGAIVAVSVVCLIIFLSDKRTSGFLKRKWISNRKKFIIYCTAVLSLLLISSACLYYLKKDSADGRVFMGLIANRMIGDNPITGVGYGAYSGVYSSVQADFFTNNPDSRFISVADSPQFVFNEYLHIGAELGVFGLLLVLLLLGISIYKLFRFFRPFAYGLIALMIFAVFSYPLQLIPFQLLIIIFLAVSCSPRAETTTKKLSSRWGYIIVNICILVLLLFMSQTYLDRIELSRKWHKSSSFTSYESYPSGKDSFSKLYPYMSDDPKFLFAYGHLFYSLGKHEESNRILKSALPLSSDPMFYNIMGNNYKAMHQYTNAEAYYQMAFSILPNRMYPLFLLMNLYADSGQCQKAVCTAVEIMEFKPKIKSSATEEMKTEAQKIIQRYGNK